MLHVKDNHLVSPAQYRCSSLYRSLRIQVNTVVIYIMMLNSQFAMCFMVILVWKTSSFVFL